MKRILLAVDGSDHSVRAAEFAGELSACFGAPVDIVNVVPETTLVAAGPIPGYSQTENVYITQRDMLKSAGTDAVARAAQTVSHAGGTTASTEVMIGRPAHTIVTLAEDVGADCIVMGRRGLGDIRGLVLGSVSHKVAQLTDTTLITVK